MNNASNNNPELRKPGRSLLAPIWHTIVLVFILLIVALGGAHFQSEQSIGGSELHQHPAVTPLYLSLILFEWLLVGFVWIGLRRRGLRVRDLKKRATMLFKTLFIAIIAIKVK